LINLPLVDMVRHKPRGSRKLGSLAGRISVDDDFDEEDPFVEEMFYGPSGK